MKKLALLFTLLFAGWSASAGYTENSSSFPFKNYGESFIFVEGGVEFAVYPNGEFDFYYDPQFSRNSVQISAPTSNISYNSGYNYDPYVQYDDYGAVIQIENVPVYYDYYGRIIQAGNIYMNYNRHGNISRLGGMRIQYNSFQRPVHYSGYINAYNSRYVYQPWHKYYARPHNSYRVVYYEPYRAYYEPVRVNYVQYNNYYNSNSYHSKNKNDYYRPSNNNVAYNNGRRTSEIRTLTSGRSSNDEGRSSNNSSARSNRDVSQNKLMERSSNPRTISRKEISNNERHAAAVRSSRNSSGVATATQRSTTEGSVISRDSRNSNARINTATTRQQESRTVRGVPQSRSSNTEARRVSTPTRTVISQRGRATNSSSQNTAAQRSQSNNRNDSVRENNNTENSRAGRSSSSRENTRTSVRKR